MNIRQTDGTALQMDLPIREIDASINATGTEFLVVIKSECADRSIGYAYLITPILDLDDWILVAR